MVATLGRPSTEDKWVEKGWRTYCEGTLTFQTVGEFEGCPYTFGSVPARWLLPGASWRPPHTASFVSWLWKISNLKDILNLYITDQTAHGSSASISSLLIANSVATYSSESTPPASMCRWLRVVMDVVRLRFAWSSCLMSRVISFTWAREQTS